MVCPKNSSSVPRRARAEWWSFWKGLLNYTFVIVVINIRHTLTSVSIEVAFFHARVGTYSWYHTQHAFVLSHSLPWKFFFVSFTIFLFDSFKFFLTFQFLFSYLRGTHEARRGKKKMKRCIFIIKSPESWDVDLKEWRITRCIYTLRSRILKRVLKWTRKKSGKAICTWNVGTSDLWPRAPDPSNSVLINHTIIKRRLLAAQTPSRNSSRAL